MKSNIIILITILSLLGCSKKEVPPSSSENTTDNHPVKSDTDYAKGKVVTVFIDTVSQTHAENFLLSRNLTVFTLENFNQALPHMGIIDVPIGQEKAWVDTLQKYPEIKYASLIMVMDTQ